LISPPFEKLQELWYRKVMEYAYQERIGKPELFTGRKEELSFFQKWIDDIKDEKSQSTAILARRKMGKTALMERLFNLIYYKNERVIPFYYEIKEIKMWIVDFCQDFFFTFIYQYISFKTRNPGYLDPLQKNNYDFLKEVIKKEGLDFLYEPTITVEKLAKKEQSDLLWETVRRFPHQIANHKKEFIVQMIDEFQFINSMVYLDKDKEKIANTMAGGYLSTAESKIAPLLVSGSWVGWLMDLSQEMLPTRFRYEFLENMPEEDAYEVIFNYSRFFEVPVTEETAYLMATLAEGSPFYISSIIRSRIRNKDLTTLEGLTDTLEFETLDNRGIIKSTWMEYVNRAFPRINDQNAKNIVLHLCQNRHRELTRQDILNDLKLDMTDQDLEKKLKALVKADIISQGSSNFRYQGVNDNIFDKVFRGVYEEEIREFDIRQIRKEYRDDIEELRKKYHSTQGKLNALKGLHMEYIILDQLRLLAKKKNDILKSITQNLPEDFSFTEYSKVWKYNFSPEFSRDFNIDVFALSKEPDHYSIIGELKNRQSKKFSKEEVLDFERKFQKVLEIENLEKAVGFIFSSCGFTQEAEDLCREKGFAFSDSPKWVEI
jgi:hypothetical protein